MKSLRENQKFQTLILELYPPFFFMGVKILSISKDYRHLKVRLPLRRYGTNHNGTMFGGFICSASDPLAALMCSKIFKNTEVWTQAHKVDFLRPGRTDLTIEIQITDDDLEAIQTGLNDHAKVSRSFQYDIRDSNGKLVARVLNTVHLKIRK